jgi:hypothetical protein
MYCYSIGEHLVGGGRLAIIHPQADNKYSRTVAFCSQENARVKERRSTKGATVFSVFWI